MKQIAPEIMRQRFLIEGYFNREISSKETVEDYLYDLAKHLELRTYSAPVIFSPEGEGKEGNQGYDAFIPLIDSGISVYIWTAQKFVSVVIYTCKAFSEEKAEKFSKDFFNIGEESVSKSF